jgi:glycosyl hydrolase family 99
MMMRWARVLSAAMLMGMSAFSVPRPAAAADDAAASPVPVLAYYYIWFDEASWNRAKIDYPLLGRYTSDDPEVMRQHVRWAKDAGIDGFIVSWKGTLVLDRRLEQLMRIASEEQFKLAIIYQGLDFHRDPQPVERVAADIDHFIDAYAADPVFDIFGGPMVIWSGTWEYTPDEIASVSTTRGLRSGCEWHSNIAPRCVLLLATEKNLAGVERLAGIVDGNAYYWSSVNPDTFPRYQEKLDEMSAAVHGDNGIWIAPAAAGFDARLIGGTTMVDRQGGDLLRRELNAATASSPDAIGLISWNEFSENSHIEPSQLFGSTALDVLADVEGGRAPVLPELDSSEPDRATSGNPGTVQDDVTGRVIALGLIVGAIGIGSVVIARRPRTGAQGSPRAH